MDSHMCHPASVAIRTGCVLVLAASLALAQRTEWRRVGGSVIEAGVSGPASGPVERVWYDAGALLARTPGGQHFRTTDFENWQAVAEAAAPERAGIVGGGSPR